MGVPQTAGGAAVYNSLNQLKADMFGIPVAVLEENDTSALGAILSAAIGAGWYDSIESAAIDACKVKEVIYPSFEYKEWLNKRYNIYKELYPAVKMQYQKLKEINS